MNFLKNQDDIKYKKLVRITDFMDAKKLKNIKNYKIITFNGRKRFK